MREAGYTEGYSLPTIRLNTDYPSFEAYLEKQMTKNGRKHARKQFAKAEGIYKLTAYDDYEPWIPRVFGLHRAVFLKAKYQFEELPPSFFAECAKSVDPKTELLVCERNDGRIVGSMLIFYNDREQQNKRIGIDYDIADSGLIYNLLITWNPARSGAGSRRRLRPEPVSVKTRMAASWKISTCCSRRTTRCSNRRCRCSGGG
jgi:hypothetical protein